MNNNKITVKQWIILFASTLIIGFLAIILIPRFAGFIHPMLLKAIFYLIIAILIMALAFTKPWRNPNVNVGEEGLLDRKGVVVEDCIPLGYVKIGNELWKAKSSNNESIVKGDIIVVRRSEGLCLIIEKCNDSINRSPA